MNFDYTPKWVLLTETETYRIYRMRAGEIHFGPDYAYLKAEPEIPELEGKIYGSWAYKVANGVFLEEWNSTQSPNASLVHLNFETKAYTVIQREIHLVGWKIKEDDDYYYLDANLRYIDYRIKKSGILGMKK